MFGNPDLPQREGVQLRAAWAEALGTTLSAFEGSSVTRVERDDLGAVIVVAVGDATVIAGPPRVKAALASLPVAALRDADAIAAALPGARTIGTGHLLFTGTRPGHPPLPVIEASSMDVASVGASLPDAAWAEAGVQQMEHRWAVRDGGIPVAVAGYQRWHGTVAHVGVATTPGQRRRGFAFSAASAAVCAAIDAGLVAQWRTPLGNDASLRLAEQLGFTRLGAQAAVALPRD